MEIETSRQSEISAIFAKSLLTDSIADLDYSVAIPLINDLSKKEDTEVDTLLRELEEYRMEQELEYGNILRSASKSLKSPDSPKMVLDNGRMRRQKERKPLVIQSIEDVMITDFPPEEYIIDNFIATGIILLSARSKIGKSWFSLQLALAVASGSSFLGRQTNKGEVFYFDLEETAGMLKKRVNTMQITSVPKGLFIINDCGTMADSFESDLIELLENHRNAKLVIIDVFQKIRKPKKANQSDYEAGYQDISPLKEIAAKYHVGIMLVMHNRKMNDDTDPFSNILGSTATMGASDQAIVIHKKKRADQEATLSITGRTVATDDFQILFDKERCTWSMIGCAQEVQEKKEEAEYRNNPIVKTIVKLVQHNSGEYTGKVSEIIAASKYFEGCAIHSDPKKVGVELKKIVPLLEKYDGIQYYATSRGTAPDIKTFKKIFV